MLAPLQSQVTMLWKKQTVPQRITLVALFVTGIILIPLLITWANKPTYSVAYNGLSEEDASQIVQKMDEAGIAYQLKDTGTILVASDQVYAVRLKMARDGLPQKSTVGYELFSGNTLGMTEFTQRVNYQRALEGELERTIGSLDSVEAVRVHVVTPEKSLLSTDQSPTTASITIKEKAGDPLDASQVRAITHLVASSVESLLPENVVVVDANGNLLAGGSAKDQEMVTSQTDMQRSAEVAASTEVKKRVQSMLDTILGPNRSVVQVSVRMDWSQKEVTSSMFDPTQTAVRSSQKVSETSNGSGDTAGGVPGAASNLPTPVATTVTSGYGGAYQRTEETINYEVSQVQTHEIVNPGQIKQVSISVMVDKLGDAAQLESIKAAVAAAAGIDATRGDVIVVNSMAFDRTYYEQQAAELTSASQTNRYLQIGLTVAGVLLVGFLIWYFLKVFRNLRMTSGQAWKPILMPVGAITQQQGSGSNAYSNLAGGNNPQSLKTNDVRIPDAMVSEINLRQKQMATNSYPEDEQRSRVITRLTEENPATVAEIIQIWLGEENHG